MIKVDGQKLRAIRKKRNLSVETVAKKAGVSQKTVFRMESVSHAELFRDVSVACVAKVLGVEVADLGVPALVSNDWPPTPPTIAPRERYVQSPTDVGSLATIERQRGVREKLESGERWMCAQALQAINSWYLQLSGERWLVRGTVAEHRTVNQVEGFALRARPGYNVAAFHIALPRVDDLRLRVTVHTRHLPHLATLIEATEEQTPVTLVVYLVTVLASSERAIIDNEAVIQGPEGYFTWSGFERKELKSHTWWALVVEDVIVEKRDTIPSGEVKMGRRKR